MAAAVARGGRSSSSSGLLVAGGRSSLGSARHPRPSARRRSSSALLVAGVGCVLAVVALLARGASDKLQSQLRDIEIERRLRGRSDMEQELRGGGGRGQAARDARAGGPGGGRGPACRRGGARPAIVQLEAQLKGLIGARARATLPKLRDTAALDIEQKTRALEQLGPIAKEPRARERLEVEVRDPERRSSAPATTRPTHAPGSRQTRWMPSRWPRHAERLAGWRSSWQHSSAAQRVYDATLKAIERAEQATMKYGDPLPRAADGPRRRPRSPRAATGACRVDDKTLDIDVFAPERGDWVDVTTLSQGTLDIVYLAARIGLVRLVTGDRRPPLVFDDPFVTLDDERARAPSSCCAASRTTSRSST